MRLGPIASAAGMATMLGAGVAQAAPTMGTPIAPPTAKLRAAVDNDPAPSIELVRGGCGWGAHRTWHGRCHLNYGWRGRVRAHWSWHHRWGWHRW